MSNPAKSVVRLKKRCKKMQAELQNVNDQFIDYPIVAPFELFDIPASSLNVITSLEYAHETYISNHLKAVLPNVSVELSYLMVENKDGETLFECLVFPEKLARIRLLFGCPTFMSSGGRIRKGEFLFYVRRRIKGAPPIVFSF